MSKLIPLFIRETGLDLSDLTKIIRTAPRRYKVYQIPKRSGGMREIAQPARELKQLQRVILNHIIGPLPVHSAATAYRSGLSIRDNALPHAGDGPILKMDFQNFFPSIKSSDWYRYCVDNDVLDEEDREISSLVMFRRESGERVLKLSIGAPSSPALSNVLMYNFDSIVQAAAVRRRIFYTRYADDMTFSGQRAGMLKDMIQEVVKATRSITYPKLRINDGKTTFITASRRRTVTGVTLTNDGTLSIGRDRKRRLSAAVHHASLGKLSREQLRELAGLLAFANVVEPQFISWLETRYGDAVDRVRKEAFADT